MRAGDDDVEGAEGEQPEGEADGKAKKKRARRFDDDTSATLVQPQDINLEKHDLAFAVDPLFHHMSSKFDEGSIAGLLMSNLHMLGGCNLAFNSNASIEGLVQSYPEDEETARLGCHAWLLPQLAQCATHNCDEQL